MQWRKMFPTPVMSREYCHCSEDEPPAGIFKKKKSAVTERWGDVSTQALQEQYII